MSLPDDPAQQIVPVPFTTYDPRSRHTFRVFRKRGNLFMTDEEVAPDGKLVFTDTQKIEFVLGSGSNGFSYIVRRGDYLFQAPLTFYTKSHTWGLSPGYEAADLAFSRPIQSECIVCHSGQPQPAPGRNGLYKNPPFRELSIGCENCHGPGQLHVEARSKGIPVNSSVDPTIVNPAKLPHWLANNICMNCHQSGDARILMPGKDFMDFRPGKPLAETVALFAMPPKETLAADSPLLQHYALMILSKCYRKSSGNLSCITCHDPHYEPSPEQAPSYYRKKCLICHSEASCSLPLQARLQKTSDNCIGCHMPKVKLRGIPHAALTNHRITLRPSEPYPQNVLDNASVEALGFVYLDQVPGEKPVSVPPIVLLQAYRQFRRVREEYEAPYQGLLDLLAKQSPKSIVVSENLALKELKEKTSDGNIEAIRYLSQAVQLGSTSPADYALLGGLLARSGNISKAISILRRGIDLDPYYPELYLSLGLIYRHVGEYSSAIGVLNDELSIFPEDSLSRKLLEGILAAQPQP